MGREEVICGERDPGKRPGAERRNPSSMKDLSSKKRDHHFGKKKKERAEEIQSNRRPEFMPGFSKVGA